MSISTLSDYYASKGQALPSLTDRTSLATAAGITGYQGTADQNNSLLAYLQKSSPASTDAIAADSLSTPTPVAPTIPTPAGGTSHATLASTASNIIAGNNSVVSPPASTTSTTGTDTSSSDGAANLDLYNKLLTAIQPPSSADTLATDNTNAGIDQKQADVNTNSAAVLAAQSKLSALNASVQGITDNATAQKLALTGQGRGITTGVISGESARIDKEAAIQALPLQVQVLGAQADVAAAQGNATLSQQILTQAQDQVDNIFQAQQTDITNKYTYQKNLVDQYYSLATTEEQAQLDAKKTADAQAFTTQQNNLNNAQSIAATAVQAGQADIAAKITQLDPASPTFTTDLAKLEAQIQPKTSTAATQTWSDPYSLGGNLVQKNNTTGEIRTAVNTPNSASVTEQKAQYYNVINQLIAPNVVDKNGVPYIDSSGYMTVQGFKTLVSAAQGDGLSRKDFLSEYAPYLSPDHLNNYGLTPAEQKSITGALPE